MSTFKSVLNDLNMGGLEPAIDAANYIDNFSLRDESLNTENERAILLARTILNAALIIAWSNISK